MAIGSCFSAISSGSLVDLPTLRSEILRVFPWDHRVPLGTHAFHYCCAFPPFVSRLAWSTLGSRPRFRDCLLVGTFRVLSSSRLQGLPRIGLLVRARATSLSGFPLFGYLSLESFLVLALSLRGILFDSSPRFVQVSGLAFSAGLGGGYWRIFMGPFLEKVLVVCSRG